MIISSVLSIPDVKRSVMEYFNQSTSSSPRSSSSCSGKAEQKPHRRTLSVSACESVFKREENLGRSSEKSREQELHSACSQKPNSQSTVMMRMMMKEGSRASCTHSSTLLAYGQVTEECFKPFYCSSGRTVVWKSLKITESTK